MQIRADQQVRLTVCTLGVKNDMQTECFAPRILGVMNSSPTTDASQHRELSRRFLKALRTHITGLQRDLFEMLEDLDELQNRHTPFWRRTRRRFHQADRDRWHDFSS